MLRLLQARKTVIEDNKSMMTKQSAGAYQRKYYHYLILSLIDFINFSIKCSVLILMCKHIKTDRKYPELKGKISYWDSCPIALLSISKKGRSRRKQ